MLQSIVFVLVVQIYYCSAQCTCECSGYMTLPTFAVYLIGITIPVLLFTVLVLVVLLYKLKRVKGSVKHTIFGNNRHVSISKYERQLSGNSRNTLTRDSMYDDDSDQLPEGKCNENENFKKINSQSNEVTVEINEPPKKVIRQPKVPVFPQVPKEQMKAIIDAVLLQHSRMKESTSLSDLDKIISDGKNESEKSNMEVSASTPALDVYDTIPSHLPVRKVNSKELRLQEEMKARFQRRENKSIIKENKNKTPDDEIKLGDNRKEQKDDDVTDGEIKRSEDKRCTKSGDSDLEAELKANITDCSSNPIHNEIKKTKNYNDTSVIDEFKEKLNSEEVKSIEDIKNNGGRFSVNFVRTKDEAQDDIYDFPPSPRPSNDLYDFPPSPRPHNDGSNDEIYDCPPSPRRMNIIVSDESAPDYLFPLSVNKTESNENLVYTNAKDM